MATTNYGWTLPTVGGSEDAWGDDLNTLWTDLDTLLGGVSATEFAKLDGLTATTAELNKLDGVTVSTAEINYLDGVTSAIQAQLDGKAANTTQDTSTWEAGTGTDASIVSPADVKAAVEANGSSAPDTGLYTVTSTVATTSGSTASITGLDETKSYLLVLENVQSSNDSTNEELKIRLSSDNGSSYSSTLPITDRGERWDTTGAYGEIRLLKPAGLFSSAINRGGGNEQIHHNILGAPSGMSAAVDAVRFEWSGGDFAAGNIKVIEVS